MSGPDRMAMSYSGGAGHPVQPGGSQGGWTQVQRTVWVAAAALAEERQGGRRADGRNLRRPDGRTARRSADLPPPPPSRLPSRRPLPPPRRRTPCHASSSGRERPSWPDPVALRWGPWRQTCRRRSRPARGVGSNPDGGWVRTEDVRPAGRHGGGDAGAAPSCPREIPGAGVVWRLQFIALQVADELRPELAPGEPYVLARGPLPEAGFVYVA